MHAHAHAHAPVRRHARARGRARTHIYTHKYIILIDFRRQQLLRVRASILRYTYIACLVKLYINLAIKYFL